MEPWQTLDAAAEEDAGQMLAACCGATRWVARMLARRPFGSSEALLRAAREEWFALSESDWREAFAHHPRIGDRDELRRRFPATAHLSEQEQAGVTSAADEVLDALAEGNLAYEDRFGYIFIVCATGKTAGEMLALLRERLEHHPAEEISLAAGEQARITALRLMNL
ncbi:2-oxo-4-hydroxy-4-carboxy-5-ureidoimidazoline decarboxylase [soil metagenome]|nr:2-oxo-4-hydroxy-4-carboxy-5-ureidoimidazoline decarboxylase [Acidobacteriota bacterium]